LACHAGQWKVGMDFETTIPAVASVDEPPIW
jgi:hypothetical protein